MKDQPFVIYGLTIVVVLILLGLVYILSRRSQIKTFFLQFVDGNFAEMLFFVIVIIHFYGLLAVLSQYQFYLSSELYGNATWFLSGLFLAGLYNYLTAVLTIIKPLILITLIILLIKYFSETRTK